MKESNKAMQSLGERIRKARAQAGLSQEQLAELIGISRSAVARWEAGDNEPTLYNLRELAATLHVSCDYLLCMDGSDAAAARPVPLSPQAEAALSKFIEEIKKEARNGPD